jgi:hypothetical protein
MAQLCKAWSIVIPELLTDGIKQSFPKWKTEMRAGTGPKDQYGGLRDHGSTPLSPARLFDRARGRIFNSFCKPPLINQASAGGLAKKQSASIGTERDQECREFHRRHAVWSQLIEEVLFAQVFWKTSE